MGSRGAPSACGRYRSGRWDESGYLSINPDVSVEVSEGTSSAATTTISPPDASRDVLAGFRRAIGMKRFISPSTQMLRPRSLARNSNLVVSIGSSRGDTSIAWAATPTEWDEAGYLQDHPDVADHIWRDFFSGYHHYLAAGRAEHRLGGFQPADWNEARGLPPIRTSASEARSAPIGTDIFTMSPPAEAVAPAPDFQRAKNRRSTAALPR